MTGVVVAGLVLAWPSSPPAPPQSAVGRLAVADAFDRGRVPPGTSRPAQAEPVVSASPVRLLIPALELDTVIEGVGIDSTGAMAVPDLLAEVGWYRLGPVPGDTGDAVIDGHAGYPGKPLVFGRLHELRPGDSITVALADGTRRQFKVTSVGSWSASAHPPGLFQTDGTPRLSLITCAGDFDPRTLGYSSRLIVEASAAGS